jgi:succinate dehydrogenase/fumarate reductase-like Fe-S protein
MGRADSLVKLAWAYGLHQTRRRVTRPRSQLADLLDTYEADGIKALEPSERERLPSLVGCINCGLCALAAGRMGKTRLPDVAASYMRLYARLGAASSDVEGDSPDFVAAAAACPVGVPLAEVAAIVRRLSEG